MALVPGSRLDRYELLFPLAEGGMAQVWVARLPSRRGLDTLFAIKVLSSRLERDPAALAMLIDEARIAARIRHPNVAQIVELGEQDGTSYLVLEWVDGESLSLLRREAAGSSQPFPTNVALTILSQAAAGLHAAHQLVDDDGSPLNVVHRDVSPQNILVGVAGEVKVIDFGIAKAERRLGETTRQGDIKGKVQYMAPEQLGDAEVDRRVDIWGLGAVLYQMLSGRPPYAGHDELGTLKRLLAREPPPPLPDLSPALAAILARTLCPDPSRRFATAEELGHALEEAARDHGGLAPAREIARLVDQLVGPRLSERRAATRGSSGVALPAVSGARTTESTKTAPTERLPVDGSGTGASSVQTLPTLPALYRRQEAEQRRARGLTIGLIALGLVIGGGVWVLSQRAPEVPVADVEAVPSEPGPAAAAGTASGPASTSTSKSTSTSTSTSTSASASASAAPKTTRGPRRGGKKATAPRTSETAKPAAKDPQPSFTAVFDERKPAPR